MVVVIAPLVVLAAISGVCMVAFSAWSGKRPNYLNLVKAMWPLLGMA
jgi:hypothetical protein